MWGPNETLLGEIEEGHRYTFIGLEACRSRRKSAHIKSSLKMSRGSFCTELPCDEKLLKKTAYKPPLDYNSVVSNIPFFDIGNYRDQDLTNFAALDKPVNIVDFWLSPVKAAEVTPSLPVRQFQGVLLCAAADISFVSSEEEYSLHSAMLPSPIVIIRASVEQNLNSVVVSGQGFGFFCSIDDGRKITIARFSSLTFKTS
ncbi:hypothetical protein BC829DRAFT_412671 [Chytridium lagenaria]|nr:hypothetical protein BC829DRAFT_412671 [Chytridium lagenaria]